MENTDSTDTQNEKPKRNTSTGTETGDVSLLEAIPGSQKTLAGSALLAAWLIIWSARDELVDILKEAPDMWYLFVAAILAGTAITITRYLVQNYTVGQDKRHHETIEYIEDWGNYLEYQANDLYGHQTMEFSAQNQMLRRIEDKLNEIQDTATPREDEPDA